MAKKARSKQEKFLRETAISQHYNILGLNYFIPELGVTLWESIMAIRSTTHTDKNLFITAEEANNSSDVSFLYHESLADEAMTAIPALPLILEAQLGPRVWTWFHEDAKDDCEHFCWDPDRGIVDKDGDLANWTLDRDSDSDSDGDSTATAVINSVPFALRFGTSSENFYNDAGTIHTDAFRDAASRSVASTSTLTDNSSEPGYASRCDHPPHQQF
jgi:hypothetical protein